MSPPILTLTKLSTPHPWLSKPAPTPATCLDLSRAVWLAVRSDSETHPTTPPPESHRQSIRVKQSLVPSTPPISLLKSYLYTATLPPSPFFTAPPTILKPHTLLPPRPTPHTQPGPVVGMQRATGTHLPSHHLSFITLLSFARHLSSDYVHRF